MTLPTKVHFVKAMVFPVVMYGCESWIIKKAERQRIDVFELWMWRRLLRVPWTARRFPLVSPKGNQPWIFIWKTDAEAKALILWPPDAKSWLIGKDLVLGKTESERRSRDQRMRWFDSITDSMVMNLSKLWETVEDRETWYATVHVIRKSRTWLSNRTAIAVVNYNCRAVHTTPGLVYLITGSLYILTIFTHFAHPLSKASASGNH